MSPATPPTIHAAMAEVMRAVGPVAKNLRNVQSGYAARSIDDVMDALHGPMSEAGVFVVPTVEDAELIEVEVGKNRTRSRQATLTIAFTFYGPAGDSISARTVAEALDTGDKAVNKALSAGLKYVLLQTFLVPLTGDDADAASYERSSAEPEDDPLLDKAQRENLRKRIEGLSDPAAAKLREAWKAAQEQHLVPKLDAARASHLPAINKMIDEAVTAVIPTGALVDSAAVGARSIVRTPDPTADPADAVEAVQQALDAVEVCGSCGQPTSEANPACPEHPTF